MLLKHAIPICSIIVNGYFCCNVTVEQLQQSTYSPQSLKYLLPGPLQRMFAVLASQINLRVVASIEEFQGVEGLDQICILERCCAERMGVWVAESPGRRLVQ